MEITLNKIPGWTHYEVGEQVYISRRNNGGTLGTRVWELGRVVGYNMAVGLTFGIAPVVAMPDGSLFVAMSSKFKRSYTNNIRPIDFKSRHEHGKFAL